MVIGSYTQTGKNYDVVLDQTGEAVDCTCGDRKYRKHTCKHMIVANSIVLAEIEKAETFLSLKAQIEHPAPLYSRVCGHLVKKNVHRHCGCMA